MELARLLMSTCSEIEITFKEIIKKIDKRRKPKNIDDIRKIVLPKFPSLENERVRIRSKKLEFYPWKNWSNQSPKWWKAYNKVKHDRLNNYKYANLENVLNSVAGYGVTISLCGDFILPRQNFKGDFFDCMLRLQIFKPGKLR